MAAIRSTAHHLRRETGLVRGARQLLRMNQADGFDCPGCAWPDPDDRSRMEFCENGAKALAEEATRKRATPQVLETRTVDSWRTLSDFELGQLGRITHPVMLDEARRYREVSWDDAFARIGAIVRAQDHPDRVLFYTSGRTSNEAAFLLQLLGRKLGTNNFPDCSNMCHESSGVGLGQVLGVGKGTVSLEDFEHTDLILVIGQNPGTNHPRMLSTLREAARRGATIVSINPLREAGLIRFKHPQKVGDMLGAGTALASEFLQVRIGGDLALLRGLIKHVLEREAERPGEVLDRAFLEAHTTGLDALRDAAAATPWARIVAESGVAEADLRRIGELYVAAERTIVCWAMGITQHKHGVANVQEIVNLLLLRGNLGRPGAGACPVRGHSNVQGDRSMGITTRPKAGFLDRLGAEMGFEPPREPGLDTVAAIEAMHAGRAPVFLSMGGNFYSASPDTRRTGEALERCALTVHISTKINRAHLYPGQASIILPCLGRTERDIQDGEPQVVTVEDSMSMVHVSRGTAEPASDALRSEPAIVAGLARAILDEDWSPLVADYDRIRAHIARVVPGCQDYTARASQPGGFRMPNGARDRDFTAVGGKARFTVHELPSLALPAGKLRLMTMRSHDQYNTTIYGLDDRYRGVRGERRVVFLHPEDMQTLGVTEGQRIDLVSEWEDGDRRAEGFVALPYDIPRGCAGAYFPEANSLVPLGSYADGSRTPTSKSIVIRIEPATPSAFPSSQSHPSSSS